MNVSAQGLPGSASCTPNLSAKNCRRRALLASLWVSYLAHLRPRSDQLQQPNTGAILISKRLKPPLATNFIVIAMHMSNSWITESVPAPKTLLQPPSGWNTAARSRPTSLPDNPPAPPDGDTLRRKGSRKVHAGTPVALGRRAERGGGSANASAKSIVGYHCSAPRELCSTKSCPTMSKVCVPGKPVLIPD